jgi:hypothetical protein
MHSLSELVANNAREDGCEAIPLRLWIEVDASKVSPDDRAKVGRLAAEAIQRSLTRKSWFVRVTYKDSV